MADALKEWLRTRLGVIIDLTPEMFGRHSRDGTLLAQILHSYDIISSSQLSTIIRTQDPALSRVNLRTLRIWLKLINVTLSDECIDEISKGKGAAALQLYYKVYLSLEGKDRLHFIALQKERKYMPSRFDISKVSEDPSSYRPPEHPLSQSLIESADTILWHRSKFWAITQACRQERQRFETLMKYPVIEPVEHIVSEELPDQREIESETLDEFARKHPPRKMKKHRVVECCFGKRSLDMPYIEDPVAAAKYTDLLKKRSEKAAKSHASKLKIQTTMMTEAWERLLRKQDRSFDEALGRRVLDQSRYEKQMIRKLCEVRDLRNRIVENRTIVDAMLLTARENELRMKEDRHREILKEEIKDVEMEDRRMRELRSRIHEEKMRKIREKHRVICLKIMEDLADIAIKIADYRQTNNNHIPYSISNEWRTSFLRNQPIFELADHLDDFDEQIEDIEEIKNKEEPKNKEIMKNKIKTRNGEETRNKKEIKIEKKFKAEEKLVRRELERWRSLADADFENYHNLDSPWNQFVSKGEGKDEEVIRLGRIVLGYVVHRLLEILYPYPSETVSCLVPRVKVAAIILGIINPTLHEQLRELLKNNGIYLLRMEDAINHCLERYKQEMADVEYIDLNIVSTMTRDVKRLETKSKMDISRDRNLKKIERTMKVATSQQNEAEEKQTQTPRQIPYDDMDPILSDTAYIGKWTYEFLTLGEPISDELNTKILIEYIKGIEDVKGWALINYPNTYEQMAMLEKALTGREVPPDRQIINFAGANIEDIDPSSARIIFEGDENTFAKCRQSRLLPNPISRAKDNSSTTFMTIYIKVMLKSKTIDSQDQPCIPLPDDATSMDEYYANENIAYGFFYNILDFSALKQLAEFIAGQSPEKQLEFFENISQTYHDKQGFPIDPKAVVIKRLIPKSKWENLKYEKKKDIEIESSDLQPEVQIQPANSHVKPGEDDWQWINFSQPSALLEILATFWESIEEAYIENLKEILSLKRMHTSAIVPYKNLVLRNLIKFVERPDKRQVLLQAFHRAFNEIDEELRDDSDMKCELHCRVDDFRMELWDLCDARRHEAEEERKRILRNEWIPMEAIILVNVYIGILQAEIDRFVDTMQLLQDYYTSMSQKSLQEPQFSKIVLDHTLLDVLEASLLEDKERILSKTKIDSINASARRNINMDHFKTEIETLLIDVSKSFEPDQSIIYSIIKDNIRQVRNVVDSISSMTLEMLKKEEKIAIPKINKNIKNKSIGNASPDLTVAAKLARRNRDLIEEWRYAVLFEIDRINQKLDVLNAAARFDMIFLLDIMKETFHGVYHYIIERYKREIESINEMTNVFCFAIEEERPIQQELLLDGDRFVVKSKVSMFPEVPKRFIPKEEVPTPLRFRMVQLGRLIDIFGRIAPHGTISERALIYVLQDLVSCGEEDCYPSFVPCAWQQLRPPDIEKLIEGLFGAAEYIEWREFVLYAMDLPAPSHQDILKARMAFRMQDPDLRETITRDQFHSTPLWFLEISTRHEKLLDEKLDRSNCNETMDLMLREELRLGQRISNVKSNFIETDKDHSSAILRLTLAKELLCRMYLVNRNAIHYTAMLLTFCKDKDPREGLGKAFTLAMGARVCTDTAEGERYVDELVEEKRRVKESKLSRNYLRNEANEVVREIISHIMSRMTKAIIMFEKIYDHDLPAKHRIMIQQLNGLGEIDPAELLPPEAKHLVNEDLTVLNDEHKPYLSSVDGAPEDYEIIQQDERVIFWLPRDVCLTVLSTCLPWLASQANLFQTSMNLCEGIQHVYNELKDEELNDDENLVLAHRLLNHSFIHELLNASSKFVSKNMADLLRNILKKRHVTI